MRKSRLLSLLLLLSPSLLWAQPAAPDPALELIFSRYRNFKIPWNPGPGVERLRQLQLYVSTDQGRTWQPAASAPPEQRYFKFMTDRDGLFWFTVQTLDREGRSFPATLEGAQPSLKVLIDTQPPAV